MFTAALCVRRLLPFHHQGLAASAGDAIKVIPLSQQRPSLHIVLPTCELDGAGGREPGGEGLPEVSGDVGSKAQF
jgi:hypothetical protein